MNMDSSLNNNDQPGRSCPLHYRYSPTVFARAADIQANTLYVVGGLYGNLPALETILDMAAAENGTVRVVFNGDFNWFNIDAAGFQAINREVLKHHALRGNVETEIAGDDDATGCGCGYPEWVSDQEVVRSNEILDQLRETSRAFPTLRKQLAALPMHWVAEVGGLRTAIVHGDLQSLAGWDLAQENFDSDEAKNIVQKQILISNCRIVASSHTCLSVALGFDTPTGRCAIFNNGAAGMPNFRGACCGVITRIATRASSRVKPLYATHLDGVHVEALKVDYDAARWQREFLANWPAESAAHQSYYRRISEGPAYDIAQANRL